MLRNEANDGLGEMDVEVVANDIPPCVGGHTSSSRALSRTPILSAACKIKRARNANCCEVEWARTSASSASRCAGKTITGSAASQGIAIFPLSFLFVMPRRRRFDSCFVAGKQPRSYYHVPSRKAESQLPLGGTSDRQCRERAGFDVVFRSRSGGDHDL